MKQLLDFARIAGFDIDFDGERIYTYANEDDITEKIQKLEKLIKQGYTKRILIDTSKLESIISELNATATTHGSVRYAEEAKSKAIEELQLIADYNEADELLQKLGLNPEQYRTCGGTINHLKVKAAILNPSEYLVEDPCPQCIKGGVCRTPTCGRLKLKKA